jgi:hypothetical protein
MVSRRQVIAGTLAAGAASLDAGRLGAESLSAAGASLQDSEKLDEILAMIRQARRTYLKTPASIRIPRRRDRRVGRTDRLVRGDPPIG